MFYSTSNASGEIRVRNYIKNLLICKNKTFFLIFKDFRVLIWKNKFLLVLSWFMTWQKYFGSSMIHLVGDWKKAKNVSAEFMRNLMHAKAFWIAKISNNLWVQFIAWGNSWRERIEIKFLKFVLKQRDIMLQIIINFVSSLRSEKIAWENLNKKLFSG